jgi:hypothetical protein
MELTISHKWQPITARKGTGFQRTHASIGSICSLCTVYSRISPFLDQTMVKHGISWINSLAYWSLIYYHSIRLPLLYYKMHLGFSIAPGEPSLN